MEKKIFASSIRDFFQSHNEAKAIFFFQGFPDQFYNELLQEGYSHFLELTPTVYIDYKTINAAKILAPFISSSGLKWGYYEEFIAITKALNDLSAYDGKIYVVKNNFYSHYFPINVSGDPQKLLPLFENEKQSSTSEPILDYYSDLIIIDNICFYSYIYRHFEEDMNKHVKELDFFTKTAAADNRFEFQCVKYNAFQVLIKSLLEGKLHDSAYEIQQKINEDYDIDCLNGFSAAFNVYFKIQEPTSLKQRVDSDKHLDLLQKYWGSNARFRMNRFYSDPATSNEVIEISQGDLVNDVILQSESALKGKDYSDIVVTAPTGAGKSLLFQLPSIYIEQTYSALTVVVCPLVALMHDQVKEIQEDHGVGFATYINSELTFEERRNRIDGIIDGRYSLVYLSPEFLLSQELSNIVGDRKIGLFVIDEAHLVTSWGRDFRVDYWFLGDYINKVRRGTYRKRNTTEHRFPVLCLTATAVYNGRDDVIGDLESSLRLSCDSDHLYIGYVRRENIEFIIRRPERKGSSDKVEKTELTAQTIGEFVNHNEKAIVYFPFVSQVDEVDNYLKSTSPEIKKVERYNGAMHSLEKDGAYSRFRNSESLVMMCTKAFGMGVNIPDVLNVYHYAPTGTLADYVQEIGRAARKLDKGYSITDYLPSDMRYARTLWGLSGLRHYQIHEIIRKLSSLYQAKRCRNMLFSPETFSYLFDAKSVDQKVKSGLMVLSSDLLDKYHFNVITVRAKNLFAAQFAVIPREIESAFLARYGKYCKRMNDSKPRKIPGRYSGDSEERITLVGDVFDIQLAEIWENAFEDVTFAQFKYKFFSGELFDYQEKISPKIKLVISYDDGYNSASEKMARLADAIQRTFNDIYRKYSGRDFSFSDFHSRFQENYGEKTRTEYTRMLLDIFCYEGTDIYDIPSEQWKFISKRWKAEQQKAADVKYSIRGGQKYSYIARNLKRNLIRVIPNSDDEKRFVAYLNVPKRGECYSYEQLTASILQLFGFASYELVGGRNPQVFVRINDPLKLQRLAESKREYKNRVLSEIEDRHKRAVTIMNAFMQLELSNETRWNIIEQYFLGHDEDVDAYLGISDLEIEKQNRKKSAAKGKNQQVRIDGQRFLDTYSNWADASGIMDGVEVSFSGLPLPESYGGQVSVDNLSVEFLFAWPEKRVILSFEALNSDELLVFTELGWTILNLDTTSKERLKSALGVE